MQEAGLVELLFLKQTRTPLFLRLLTRSLDGKEVLYTLPAKERGQVSGPNSKSSALKTSEWTVKDVDSDSIDAFQVELSCSSETVEISYVVSLYPLSMKTAVIVKNKWRKAINLNTALLSYFKLKKRSNTGVQGL
ncbi:Syntaxin-22 [Olea europaea subsp. europaea]|uniref:Syntaxin-22 n=1 Tax=Olea europaea subsp. europaea TaxID=158383 RepID=A0A8S0U4Z7_OLEEU|nr:Syntaxin-22 [Olea europaea subsp. europaea]